MKSGLCIENSIQHAIKNYTVNHNFFSIPNELNCYWAGFIAADGCVYNNALQIELSIQDELHLKKFCKDIQYTGKFVYRNRNNEVAKDRINCKKDFVRISISDKKICQDLNDNFNITPKKSLTLQPPNLNNENLIKSYIVGLIDGDGWIGFDNTNINCSILGTREVLDWINGYFNKWYSPKFNGSTVCQSKDSQVYRLFIKSKRAYQILSMLQCINIQKLNRKWDKLSQHEAYRKIGKEKLLLSLSDKPRKKRKYVYQYDYNTGNFLNFYYSSREAVKILNKNAKSHTAIGCACNHKLKSAFGFRWSYKKNKNYFNIVHEKLELIS